MCLPSGMFAWDVKDPGDVTEASLARVIEHADSIDVMLIGMGPDIAPIAPAIKKVLREKGVIVEAISTGSAIRTYNVLLAENRAVGAALISVQKAR